MTHHDHHYQLRPLYLVMQLEAIAPAIAKYLQVLHVKFLDYLL